MEKILTISNLTKKYNKLTAIKNISFEVAKGEIIGLLGPNGSGKTTIIKSILGLINYEKGVILIKGKKINKNKNKNKILKDLGAVLEGVRNIYWYLSPVENIDYFAGIMGISTTKIKYRKKMLLKKLNLWDVCFKEVKKLSKGMKQKTSIACSLIHNPSILFLDEPTIGLDVETKSDIKKMLINISKKESKTIVITSHDMKFIEDICDKIIIINKGELVYKLNGSFLKSNYIKKRFKILTCKNIKNISKNEINKMGNYNLEQNGENYILNIYLKNDDLYGLFDLLEKYDIRINNLSTYDINLEDIFMNLITDKDYK